MLKWSELKRTSDVVLAVWPHYRPLFECWFMQELVYEDDLMPAWRERMVPSDGDTVRSEHYPDRDTAIAAANALNPTLKQAITAQAPDPVARRSLELKVDKALQAKQRLQEEEAFMLAEALRRHAGDDRPDAVSLKLAPEAERYRQDLAEQLAAMPYLKVAKVGRSNNRWTHTLLFQGIDAVWSKPYHAGEKAALTAERAKIANGFDLSATAHWGKTKARIPGAGRTRAGLERHRLLVRGRRDRLANQGNVGNARVRWRDNLEGRHDPVHQPRSFGGASLHQGKWRACAWPYQERAE
jgi:hypothetical protein